MFTYEEYITEAKNKPVIFTFGRFNPLTSGHEIMINDVIKQAKSFGGKPLIFTSQTQDTKKNPLSYNDKTKYLKKFWGRKIIKDTSIVTAFDALEWISKKGYKNVKLVVGSDRVARFEKYMRPYVDSYGFDHFEVVQAGVARGAGNEMSASKMRKFAADGDFESYKKGMPSGASDKITKEIYDAVRAGLGIKEQYLEFGTNLTTKKYKEFTPGQAISDDKIDEAPQKWMKAYRAELSGRGSTTDHIRGGVYFFPKKAQAELWAGKHGNVIESKIRIDTASIQEVREGDVSGDGMDHDVVIRKDPAGSGEIMEIIVFNKKFVKPQLKAGTYR